jgi:hypothetical protein
MLNDWPFPPPCRFGTHAPQFTKIADFLWPRSREPILRVSAGFQPRAEGLSCRTGIATSSEQRRLYTTHLRDARGGFETLQQMAKGEPAVELSASRCSSASDSTSGLATPGNRKKHSSRESTPRIQRRSVLREATVVIYDADLLDPRTIFCAARPFEWSRTLPTEFEPFTWNCGDTTVPAGPRAQSWPPPVSIWYAASKPP